MTGTRYKILSPLIWLDINASVFLRLKTSSSLFIDSQVGPHDKLGMQVVPLRQLSPHEGEEFTLDLLKNQNPNDSHNRRPRGKLIVELKFDPFKEESGRFSGHLDASIRNQSRVPSISEDESFSGSGLLLVTVVGAQDVVGKRHNNPYALILFGGDRKKTKVSFPYSTRTRDFHCG